MWMERLNSWIIRTVLTWLSLFLFLLPVTTGLARRARQTQHDDTINTRLSNLETALITGHIKAVSMQKELSEIKSRLDTLLSSMTIKRPAYDDEFIKSYVSEIITNSLESIQDGLISEKQKRLQLENMASEIKNTINKQDARLRDVEQICSPKSTVYQTGPTTRTTRPTTRPTRQTTRATRHTISQTNHNPSIAGSVQVLGQSLNQHANGKAKAYPIRFANGSSSHDGRVEILYNGTWGTICDDLFGSEEAGVVCHMLGYPRENATVWQSAVFGKGNGHILLDRVVCIGDETDIVNCAHSEPIGRHNCDHGEDVGVTCEPLRLVNGLSSNEGRVEIFYNGQWGTICDDGFGSEEAGVVCHMLGYPRENAVAWHNARFGQGKGFIWFDDVVCIGNETDITNCVHRKPIGINNCGHNDDVGVTCAKRLRIVNGSTSREGRVEVFYNGQWGTICDDGFGSEEAAVVCHMLGYPRENAVAWPNAHFGQGSGTIWLDDVVCNGDEADITNCDYKRSSVNTCDHDEDIGVTCG